MMRNLYTPLPDGTLQVGTPLVGTSSADCEDLFEELAALYPGQLIRVYFPDLPSGTSVDEDGSYTGTAPSQGEVYIDGIYVGPLYQIHGGSGSGSSSSGNNRRRLWLIKKKLYEWEEEVRSVRTSLDDLLDEMYKDEEVL